MKNADLIEKGLAPKTLNLKQAAKAADGISTDLMIQMLEEENSIKRKKLDSGDYEIDTLSLLDCLDRNHEKLVNHYEQERIDYLMDLKQGSPNPRIPFLEFKEKCKCQNQEKTNG